MIAMIRKPFVRYVALGLAAAAWLAVAAAYNLLSPVIDHTSAWVTALIHAL